MGDLWSTVRNMLWNLTHRLGIIDIIDILIVAVVIYELLLLTRHTRGSALLKGLFPLLISIGGIVESMCFPNLPIYCSTCLILMLMLYIQSLELRISADPLTGLNNRGQLERYISQRSSICQEGRLTIVAMMDIDHFKVINDTYGHAEGDKALVAVADVLKRTIGSHSFPVFTGRYGGDEFILILHPHRIEEAESLIREIREGVREYQAPYELSISVGFDEWSGEGDLIRSCIERADQKLYLDKKQRE